ncbi:hypothetical protein SAMN05421855_1209 [Ulvibacter litoralis]|uniref:Uncharacterized protein n=1 Tax=Ulvibacter litoralis TaxID=227084 RepID=A0A1G7JNH9_9FLAO|nr:hypothetical protein SAMN05421855_1209 [Ulvibacter litoralis]
MKSFSYENIFSIFFAGSGNLVGIVNVETVVLKCLLTGLYNNCSAWRSVRLEAATSFQFLI